jgi:hypothetical protein
MKHKHVKPKSPPLKLAVVLERLEKVVGMKDAALTTCVESGHCRPPA